MVSLCCHGHIKPWVFQNTMVCQHKILSFLINSVKLIQPISHPIVISTIAKWHICLHVMPLFSTPKHMKSINSSPRGKVN
uniref:Uncharacterized protein n=1 Tax=Rhizophora mucronata TaxID=61149 RepID=A0A2P2PJS9_RHIMU